MFSRIFENRKGELGDIAYLDELVPASGDDDGVLGVGAEADAGNPLGVALVGDGELAVTEGVPQLDGAVTGTGDDLTVVGGERGGQNVVGVADESAGGVASGELPQTEGLVPGGRQSVSTVGGDHLCEQKVPRSAMSIPIAPIFPFRVIHDSCVQFPTAFKEASFEDCRQIRGGES